MKMFDFSWIQKKFRTFDENCRLEPDLFFVFKVNNHYGHKHE